MDSEQLEKELARVWQRVNAASAPWEGGPPAAPESQAPMDAPSIAREASLDAINLIKRQSRGESIRMAQLLELKEKQAAELRARLDAAQTENAALRRRAQREDEIVYDKLQAVSRELEAAREALKAQEESFRAEAESLRGAADGARRQSAAEAARLREMERGWFERERALLLRIAELEGSGERAKAQAERQEGNARRYAQELTAAKGAVEKTLSELLAERRERAAAEEERSQALGRLKSLEERVAELTLLMEKSPRRPEP